MVLQWADRKKRGLLSRVFAPVFVPAFFPSLCTGFLSLASIMTFCPVFVPGFCTGLAHQPVWLEPGLPGGFACIPCPSLLKYLYTEFCRPVFLIGLWKALSVFPILIYERFNTHLCTAYTFMFISAVVFQRGGEQYVFSQRH